MVKSRTRAEIAVSRDTDCSGHVIIWAVMPGTGGYSQRESVYMVDGGRYSDPYDRYTVSNFGGNDCSEIVLVADNAIGIVRDQTAKFAVCMWT